MEKCLAHDAAALAHLQVAYREPMTAFLMRAGAPQPEAQETVEMLWCDLLTPTRSGSIRLGRYNGTCALLTWLNTVALHSFYSRKRVDNRRESRFTSSEHAGYVDAAAAVADHDPSLIALMRESIEWAFENCPAQDYVLLQLEYLQDLEREELGRLFGYSKATVCRRLEDARFAIARRTMTRLRERDPWLELRWEDFLDLCRTACPACFSVED